VHAIETERLLDETKWMLHFGWHAGSNFFLFLFQQLQFAA